MSNKKISIMVGTSMIIIITIIIGAFAWKINKDDSADLSSQTSSQVSKESNLKKEDCVEISDTWTIVNHGNFWNNPNLFANRDYKFPDIEFSYPGNWDFQCCSDMDYASTHIIYSSKNHDKSLPYIRITDYALSGCHDSQKNCSLDKKVKMSATKKFDQLISDISTANILPKVELNNLNTTAFSYNKSENDGKASRGYIINLKNDVIEIDFVNCELLDENFIKNFLNQISLESSG